ncbi:MAG TPA: hypothetical protein VJH21_01240 [Candidatus Paceibacterota bacterium]
MNTNISKATPKDRIILFIIIVIAVVAVIAFLLPFVGETPTIPEEENIYRNTAQNMQTQTDEVIGTGQDEEQKEANGDLMVN